MYVVSQLAIVPKRHRSTLCMQLTAHTASYTMLSVGVLVELSDRCCTNIIETDTCTVTHLFDLNVVLALVVGYADVITLSDAAEVPQLPL
jgi:hypothetical protein